MLVINNYKEDFIGRIMMKNSMGKWVWLNLYNCNGLGAYCARQYENEKDDIVNTHLWGFWNDEQHLKNMLGLSKGYNNCYGDDLGDIYLRKPRNKWEEKKIIIIAKNLIKAGYKVTCNDYCDKQIIYNEDGKDYKLV